MLKPFLALLLLCSILWGISAAAVWGWNRAVNKVWHGHFFTSAQQDAYEMGGRWARADQIIVVRRTGLGTVTNQHVSHRQRMHWDCDRWYQANGLLPKEKRGSEVGERIVDRDWTTADWAALNRKFHEGCLAEIREKEKLEGYYDGLSHSTFQS